MQLISFLNPQLFRPPHFRFVEKLFQTGKAGEGKSIDGDRADFSDRRLFQSRTATLFVNQDEHRMSLTPWPNSIMIRVY